MLTWLIRFSIMDQVAADNGISVTQAQSQAGLSEIQSEAASSASQEGFSSATALFLGNGISPQMLPALGTWVAQESAYQTKANGGKQVTSQAESNAVTAKYNKAECQAAKSLNIQVSPQFGRLDYSTYTVVAANRTRCPSRRACRRPRPPRGSPRRAEVTGSADVPPGAVPSAETCPGRGCSSWSRSWTRCAGPVPWDREQTHASLLRYLLEEAYEAAETIEDDDMPALREEIGDVLFQVLFHARIASERSAADGGFTIDDVADTLAAKLIRRHPHVFGGGLGVVGGGRQRELGRDQEGGAGGRRRRRPGRGPPSVLDGVPFGQPALSLAAQLQRRAVRAGLPVSLPSSAGNSSVAENLGDELFRLVARASEAGIDPELELRSAARRYADLMRSWERSDPGLLSDPDRE